MTAGIREPGRRLPMVAWLREQAPEHYLTELAAVQEKFGVSRETARRVRREAERSQWTYCGCCAGVGDHPCGHECDACDGSGRNPDSPPCRGSHGADCDCDWGEANDWEVTRYERRVGGGEL